MDFYLFSENQNQSAEFFPDSLLQDFEEIQELERIKNHQQSRGGRHLIDPHFDTSFYTDFTGELNNIEWGQLLDKKNAFESWDVISEAKKQWFDTLLYYDNLSITVACDVISWRNR